MIYFNYGIICEDNQIKVFAENIINQIAHSLNITNEIKFNLDNTSIKIANGQIEIDDYKYFIPQIFNKPDINLLLIGEDLDSNEKDNDTSLKNLFQVKFNEINSNISTQYRNNQNILKKIVIFIPVQCIETWLLYIKFRKDYPDSNKNIKFET